MILTGDCLALLPTLDAGSARCCVTSPPYFGGQRSYVHSIDCDMGEGCVCKHEAQIGMERIPSDYVSLLVSVFREVRRILTDDGSLWLSIADVYAASGKGGGGNQGDRSSWDTIRTRKGFRMPPPSYKGKDLVLMSFAIAEALRVDGWYLRSTIVWKKASATEPMRLDRPAKSHEYLFLLTKSEACSVRNPGALWWGHSVWELGRVSNTEHPAEFPEALAERCILAGSAEGDTVLDPFFGSGTVGKVAERLGRRWVGIELNPAYVEIANRRTAQYGLFVPPEGAKP